MKPIIYYNFATRSRPEKFLKAVENIHLKSADKENYKIIVVADNDDTTMQFFRNNLENKYTIFWGNSKNKIDAINRIFFNDDKSIIVNMSDDMEFIKYGFDEDIRDAFRKENGRYDLDQCLHFPDGNTKNLITMSIMGGKYYNRFGYIYHPDYTSLWADNEQTLVAMMLGKYKYIDLQIFSHNHPAYGKAAFDEQYKHTESYFRIDEDVFKRRKAKNFDLPLEYKIPEFYPNSNTPV